MYGHVEIVKLLLESGADVNIQGKGEKVFEFR
jgi:ankyrin repeat protein